MSPHLFRGIAQDAWSQDNRRASEHSAQRSDKRSVLHGAAELQQRAIKCIIKHPLQKGRKAFRATVAHPCDWGSEENNIVVPRVRSRWEVTKYWYFCCVLYIDISGVWFTWYFFNWQLFKWSDLHTYLYFYFLEWKNVILCCVKVLNRFCLK